MNIDEYNNLEIEFIDYILSLVPKLGSVSVVMYQCIIFKSNNELKYNVTCEKLSELVGCTITECKTAIDQLIEKGFILTDPIEQSNLSDNEISIQVVKDKLNEKIIMIVDEMKKIKTVIDTNN